MPQRVPKSNLISIKGNVMGELKKNNADNIDFSKAGAIIKELLNQKWNTQKSTYKKLKLD